MKIEFKGAQKRFYIPEAAYFVTIKTRHNESFFREPILCDLFVENLRVCKRIKEFALYGWVIVHDHVHLLIEPRGKWNYSEIIKSLKEQSSCAINRVMGFIEGATTSSHLQHIYSSKYNIAAFQSRLRQKYTDFDIYTHFKWQKSFHDHYIRNKMDFINHLKYIIDNIDHHPLPKDWPYVFTNPAYSDLWNDPDML